MIDRESVGTLYAALAAARLEFGPIVKDKTAKIQSDKGASYSYTFADLASVIEATAPILAKHGLVVIQEPEVTFDENGALVLMHGCIAHAGGEVHPLRPLPMPVGRPGDARAIGSAISYARRYQLSAALNIAPDADDDAAQQGAQKPAERTQPHAAQQQAARAPTAPPGPTTPATDDAAAFNRMVPGANAGIDGDVLFARETAAQPRPFPDGGDLFEHSDLPPAAWYITARNNTTNDIRFLCDKMLELHRSGGSASAKQYGWLAGLLDSIIEQATGATDGHKRVLFVLCQMDVTGDNRPSATMAGRLLARLATHIKDDDGNKISNPNYDQGIADAMVCIYRAAEAVGTSALLSA